MADLEIFRSEEERALEQQCLLTELLNCERHLRMFSDQSSSALAHRVSIYREKLQSDLGLVTVICDQKFELLQRLSKVLEPDAVRRGRGETRFDAVARIYGWQTFDELERLLGSLENII
jgi:hypothetical protein